MEDLQEILVGVELTARVQAPTPGSRTAFEQALRAAKDGGARLTLLHSTWHEGELHPLTEDGRAAMDALRAEATAAGVHTRVLLTEARPWLAMLREVLRGVVDLVVVGKRDGEHAPAERRIGSVASKLLLKCPCPVWVVKPAHDLDHKLILVATDQTPLADRFVQHAASVARRAGAELHVLHAWRLPAELREAKDDLDPDVYAERVAEAKQEVRDGLEARLAELDVQATKLHLSRKVPATAIKEAVEHLSPDLLVMGTLSRGGRTGVLMGETAERLVGRLDCSILAFKPSDFVCPVPAD